MPTGREHGDRIPFIGAITLVVLIDYISFIYTPSGSLGSTKSLVQIDSLIASPPSHVT